MFVSMSMVRAVLGAAAGAWWIVGTGLTASQTAPTDVDRLLAAAYGATPADLVQLHQGRPIVTVLPSAVDREVVVAGAVRIDAPAERTLDAVRHIERLERGGGFLQTRRLSEPPVLEDFAQYHVTTEDVAALRECRPGRCAVKVGLDDYPRLASIDWTAADVGEQVDRLARRAALDYVAAYRRGGNRALAVYADASRPLFVAQEFADMVQRANQLQGPLADLATVFLEYPTVTMPAYDEFFYWSVADFGLKPVFRLNHVMMLPVAYPRGARFAVATKQLYANHYFHTGLEVRALVDDARGSAAHYLVVLNVARSDGLTGLFGGMVKGKVEAASRDGLRRALVATKAKSEARP